MKLTSAGLPGAFLIEPELHRDERGYFAGAWSAGEFAAAGLEFTPVQASISFTGRRGSIRGMHFQRPPSREGKLVRCTRGAVLDVMVDIRPDSPTFLSHRAIELTAERHNAVFIPSGLAHGFQTLTDDAELFYEMTDRYQPELAGGFRHDDPAVGIEWPLPVTTINERDATYPDLSPGDFEEFRGLFVP